MTTVAAPAVGAEYEAYRQVLAEEATRPPTEWTFKRHPAYRQILEHVSPEQGERYAEVMRAEFPGLWKQLRGTFANIALANDSVGNPEKVYYAALDVSCSPTNLRYMWQALHIWRHMKSLYMGDVDIVELGGGYGGLALFLQWSFPGIRSYTIVDVPEAGAIQTAFAEHLRFHVKTVDGTDARTLLDLAGIDHFLISAYGFSEFSPPVRGWYEGLLVPHCSHGWLVWNVPPVYPFTLAPLTVEDEHPRTGPGNQVVRF